MTGRARSLILFFAVLGLASSGMAAWVHRQLLTQPGYTSVCDVSATVNCSEAYLSRYGSIAGVPVALAGVFWFALVLVLAGAGPRAKGVFRENVPAYIFALSTLALAVVLYLGYAAFFILKAVCILCLITYVGVIGIFLISGNATSFPMTTLPRRALRDFRSLITTPVALLIALVFIAGAASAVAVFPREAGPGTYEPQRAVPTEQKSEFERWYEQQPMVSLSVPAEGAKVVIVKFNDYQCPPCKQTYLAFKSILAKYHATHPGAVKFVTKDYPLEPECNFNIPPPGLHPASCEAAVAVRLAREKGKAEEMEEWLFANQPTLSRESITEALRRIAGVQDYDARYARTLNDVKIDISLGGSIGVHSTPTFVINNRMLTNVLAPQFYDTAIQIELKKAGS